MKRSILALALLVTGMLLMTAGCTGNPGGATNTSTTTGTPAHAANTTAQKNTPGASNSTAPAIAGIAAEQNSSTAITLPVGSTTTIELKENPTTGYAWNVTLTPGLKIETDSYIMDNTSTDRVGVGGTHRWVVRGVSAGKQTFSAIYKRPWEPTTGNETAFTEIITVT